MEFELFVQERPPMSACSQLENYVQMHENPCGYQTAPIDIKIEAPKNKMNKRKGS